MEVMSDAQDSGFRLPSLTSLIPEEVPQQYSRSDPRWPGTASQTTAPYDPLERTGGSSMQPGYDYSAYQPGSYFGPSAARDQHHRGSLSSASYVESSRHSSQSTARSSLSSGPEAHGRQPIPAWSDTTTHTQPFSYGTPALQLSPGSRALAYKPEFSPPFPVNHAVSAQRTGLGPLPSIRYSPNASYASLRRDSVASSIQDEQDHRRDSFPHIMGGGHSPGSGNAQLHDARRGSHPTMSFAPYLTTRPTASTESLPSTALAVDSAGKPKKRRGNLSRKATNMLKTWLNEHVEHPYPSEDEKLALSEQTELTIAQISNWFINARRRILAPRFASKNQSAVWNEIKMNHHIHGGPMPSEGTLKQQQQQQQQQVQLQPSHLPPSVSSSGEGESPELSHAVRDTPLASATV